MNISTKEALKLLSNFIKLVEESYPTCEICEAKLHKFKDGTYDCVECDIIHKSTEMMKVKIDNVIYLVIDKYKDEVKILQMFEFADGIKRQLQIWTNKYEIIKE